MLEKHPLSDLIIIKCLKAHYGIEAATLAFLPIGADTNVSIYKALTSDQTSYFIKLKRGRHQEISVEIVELLRRSGIQQVIAPIKTIDGKSTQPIEDFTLIVYPFVEGQDGFTRNLTEDQWINLGKALKQVHEVEVPPSIQTRIRRETYSSKWRDAVRSIYPLVEGGLSGDETALNLQKFMKGHMPAIRRLVDRAEQLGEKLRDCSLEFVLCHSDIHAGNLLMDENSNLYIVDWDEPIMAPKERDLMFIGGGVGNVWNKPVEEKLFYQGYGKPEIDPTALAYYRHERIVEDIAVYSRELLLTTAGGKDRLEMYRQFIAMFDPQGVVDIAFKTDESILTRDYQPQDVQALANIFYYTIHRINIQHYTEEQVDVWAPTSCLEAEGWAKRFSRTKPIIATAGNQIVGFAEFEPNGHIDCFYCHDEWIGKGVGSALMKEILRRARNSGIPLIFSDVSITAKPFFEKWGFKVVTQQTVVRKGVELTNFKMERTV